MLPLLRNGCSLIDPFVFWRFCIFVYGMFLYDPFVCMIHMFMYVFVCMIHIFVWSICLWYDPFVFWRFCICAYGMLRFLRFCICIWYLISKIQRRIETSLVTEDVIISLLPVFKRLEEKQHIEMFPVTNFAW